MHSEKRLACALATAALLAVGACSSDSGGSPDARVCGTPVSGAGVLKDFTPPCDPGPKGVLITASGEVLALGGYDFPPAAPDNVYFVDGWEIRYDRVLVTFDQAEKTVGAQGLHQALHRAKPERFGEVTIRFSAGIVFEQFVPLGLS